MQIKIAERIVDDIDEIVRISSFDGWQATVAGEREVRRGAAIQCIHLKSFDTMTVSQHYSFSDYD
jgi:hypothetical protein